MRRFDWNERQSRTKKKRTLIRIRLTDHSVDPNRIAVGLAMIAHSRLAMAASTGFRGLDDGERDRGLERASKVAPRAAWIGVV
jgi:hypothetical protein